MKAVNRTHMFYGLMLSMAVLICLCAFARNDESEFGFLDEYPRMRLKFAERRDANFLFGRDEGMAAYTFDGLMTSVVDRTRQELAPKGWKEARIPDGTRFSRPGERIDIVRGRLLRVGSGQDVILDSRSVWPSRSREVMRPIGIIHRWYEVQTPLDRLLGRR